MLVLEEANATNLCHIAAYHIPILSIKELKCSMKSHDIHYTVRSVRMWLGFSAWYFLLGDGPVGHQTKPQSTERP